MNKLILAGMIVVGVWGAQTRDPDARQGRDDWKEFLSKEANFRALFPSEPKYSVTKTGPVELKQFMVDLGANAYSVLVSDIPGGQFENEKLTEDRLDGARNGITQKFKLEKETKITIGGLLRGREILVTNELGLVVRGRFFIVNGRLYQVLLGGSRDFVNGPEANRFLNSFMLTQ